MATVWKLGWTLILAHAWFVSPAWAAGKELQAQAQLLMSSPDVTVSGTYELPARSDVLDRMLGAPYLLAKLWGAYRFSPAYTARPAGEAIHIDDPTGIAGDVYLVQQTANRRVYVGSGALNHKLVPAFGGKMALVLNTVPKGQAVRAQVAIYVRTDSRMLGFLAWALFPLLKARVEYRMTVNAAYLGDLLKDLSFEPQKAAAKLPKEDAAALLKILPSGPLAAPKKLQPGTSGSESLSGSVSKVQLLGPDPDSDPEHLHAPPGAPRADEELRRKSEGSREKVNPLFPRRVQEDAGREIPDSPQQGGGMKA